MERVSDFDHLTSDSLIRLESIISPLNQNEVLSKLDSSKRSFKNIVNGLFFIFNSLVAIILSSSFLRSATTKIPLSHSSKRMLVTLFVPIIISSIIFGLLLLFMIFLPKVYIATSYLLTATILFILYVWLIMHYSSALPLIFLIGSLIAVFYFFYTRKEIDHSGQVCATSASFLIKYPSSFLYMIISLIPTIILTDAYAAISTHMSLTDLSGWYHIYLAFSYFWIINFLVYICDYVFSGLTIVHFFYGGTAQMPHYPIFLFFKYAFTYSFGSIAQASLLSPMLWTIRSFPPSFGLHCQNFSELGLVFCSSCGTTFSEGSKRYNDLQRQTYVGKLQYKSTIYSAGYLITWALSFGGCATGFYISSALVEDTDVIVIASVFSWAMSHFILRSLIVSMNGMADALYILYGAASSRLNLRYPTLYQALLYRQNTMR